MRRYELMLLLRPDLEDDKLQASVEKVTRAIVNGGGSLSKVSPWGKRRLAYDIGRHREASYFLIQFDIEPAQVREIERGMLISEEIMRHLVTVLEDRGTADELAPAAAARADDEEDGDGADDADRLPGFDADADDALEADDVSDDHDTSDDDVAEAETGAGEPTEAVEVIEPDAEERPSADARSERSLT
ncbi:MAG TPA: 30S ribosomal protein S6 [Candidatus Binatia bacterium]|nr:30S ribosomal protein S6 [Candidatus Binatia bacterium]